MTFFRSKISLHLLATLLLLAATLAFSKATANRKSGHLAQPLDTISRNILGLKASDNAALSDGTLEQLKPTSYVSRTYTGASGQVDLFIAFYAQQRAGESMHSPKHCLPGAGWEIWDYGSADIPANRRSYHINRYSISREGQRMLVLYWYQSKERIIASEYVGKILLARDALLQNATAGSIVRILVPDRPGAQETARTFASEVIPQMQLCFGR